MSNNLKHSLTLFWLAVILISGYKLFSAQNGEDPIEEPSPKPEQLAETLPPPAPEPQIIIQERVVTQTVVVAQTEESTPPPAPPQSNPELLEAKRDLQKMVVALAVNAKEFQPAFMEVQRLSKEGHEATRAAAQMKQNVAKLRNELSRIEAELKSYKERKEFTSGFRKYGEKGLKEKRETLKSEITQAKQALSQKEAQIKTLKSAYDKANAEKIRLHRERLEHSAWQKELKKQIQALQSQEP